MATRITLTKTENKKKVEHFFKSVPKTLNRVAISYWISECRLDVDIKSIKDIERIENFLKQLKASFKK